MLIKTTFKKRLARSGGLMKLDKFYTHDLFNNSACSPASSAFQKGEGRKKKREIKLSVKQTSSRSSKVFKNPFLPNKQAFCGHLKKHVLQLGENRSRSTVFPSLIQEPQNSRVWKGPSVGHLLQPPC